jgi:hypothetical protein
MTAYRFIAFSVATVSAAAMLFIRTVSWVASSALFSLTRIFPSSMASNSWPPNRLPRSLAGDSQSSVRAREPATLRRLGQEAGVAIGFGGGTIQPENHVAIAIHKLDSMWLRPVTVVGGAALGVDQFPQIRQIGTRTVPDRC